MVEGLTLRLLIIVAFLASFFRHLVIEFGNRPGGRLVTVIAGFRRLDVLFALAFRRLVVVARETLAIDFRMIDVDIAEFNVAVTVGARVAGRRMPGRLCFGHVTVMTSEAGGRYTLEHGALMTFFASYFYVRTHQGKRCELVVEIQINL